MNSSREPWLSVIMPTYNGARHLAAALESVRAQGAADLEIIAVDDGSTDGTLDLLRRYEAHLPLRIFPRGRQGNWVAGTNFGLQQAQGQYLCFLHQDDCWLPGRLAALRRLTAQHPEAVFFLHPARFINDRGRRVGLWSCPLPHHGRPLAGDFILPRLLVQNFIAMPAPLFKRQAAQQVGPLNEALWFTADWDFWSRLIRIGPTIYYPRPLACFRLHPSSQTTLATAAAEDVRQQLLTVVNSIQQMLAASAPLPAAARRAAEFSAAATVFLAARSHGQKARLGPLLGSALKLGPAGWRRFLRDSRITARVAARLAAGLARR